jgi:hypothetical protein
MWDGHSCPSHLNLMLMLMLILVLFSRKKPAAMARNCPAPMLS